MLKQNNFKKVGIALMALLLLAACNKQTTSTEDPALVLEKMLTQTAKVYETQSDINVDFQIPETKESGTMKFSTEEKTNVEDMENIQSEGSIDATINLNLAKVAPSTPEASESEAKQPESTLEQINVNASAKFKMIGDSLYGTLNKLELTGTAEEVTQANAILPLILGPYMEKPLYISLKSLDALMAGADQSEATSSMLDKIKLYGQDKIAKDVAESKMLKVSKDEGMEKVSSLSGKKVNTHHYQLALDPEGFKAFFEKFNQEFQMIPQEEWEVMLKEENPSFTEVLGLLNDAMTFEVWIGEEDYHPYKMEIKSDMKKIGTVVKKMQTLDKTMTLTPEALNFFEKGKLNLKLVSQSQPIKTFSLEKPADKDIIDLGPLLQMSLLGVQQQMVSPSGTMTEEEMGAMMKEQGVTEEELKAMMEEVKAPTAKTE